MKTCKDVLIIDDCHVTPSSHSEQFLLPLTFFDTYWFKFPPIQRIFYYPLPDPTREHFDTAIVPTLKKALQLTLSHFLPLAGTLTWPPHADKPFVAYVEGDGVPLRIAVSTNPEAFPLISAQEPHDAAESHAYAPDLPASDLAASPIAVQVTFFPGHGFAVGLASHHAILDGKSVSMLTKCWAHFSKQGSDGETSCFVPEEMKPSFDRSVIRDSEEIILKYLKARSEISWAAVDSNCGEEGIQRSLKLLPALMPPRSNLSRAAYEFSKDDITKLREFVGGKLGGSTPKGLSSFVLTYSYTLVCIAKAKDLDDSAKFCAMYMADCRGRGEGALIPENYFGNCIAYDAVVMKAGEMKGENGVVVVVEKLRESIRGLTKGGGVTLESAKEKLTEMLMMDMSEMEKVATGGSARLGLYERDFGWGKPAMVEMTSIEKTGAVSLADSKDGNGGVEVGIVMEKDRMEEFHRIFRDGLSHF